jgi:hypothetical protein
MTSGRHDAAAIGRSFLPLVVNPALFKLATGSHVS